VSADWDSVEPVRVPRVPRVIRFAEDIEDGAHGEQIEVVVIGPYGGYRDSEIRFVPSEKQGVVLPWADARHLLDYEYSDGFGEAECHAITAWTPTRVLMVREYDGSTQVKSVPRNPVDHCPGMV